MTIQELMKILQNALDDGLEPGTEVRLAAGNPRWILEYSIRGSVLTENALYLAEGRQVGYLPSEVAADLEQR